MRLIIAITFLLSLAECRRHLCDDGTRPICPDGTRAVYNRPTGKNSMKSNYFPPPVCSGELRPTCLDGSEAKVRFNACSDDEKKCPKGQGQGPYDAPFNTCADGSMCKCPGGGNSCKFYKRRCAKNQKCHKRCKSGVPHCPWFTKNRNPNNGPRKYNTGDKRPKNKPGGHNFGKLFPGNVAGIFELTEEQNDFCWDTFSNATYNYTCSTFLYENDKQFGPCCYNDEIRNNHCKCDCCYRDAPPPYTCIALGPLCNFPRRLENNPNCYVPGPVWGTPVCPWQGNQIPTNNTNQ